MNLHSIFEKGEDLSKEDIISLLTLSEKEEVAKLYAEVRRRMGDSQKSIKVSAIVKFSNFCEESCLFCGLREDNFTVDRFRMTPDEIIESVKTISNLGIKNVILQSGKDSYYDTDIISYIIYQIKHNSDLSINLSMRERGFHEYKTWKLAGADGYILNHEISNAKLFSIYHDKNIISSRINLLTYLKEIRFLIGSGTIIGLPKQNVDDIADDLLLYKALEVDSVTVSPFMPAPFTPYQNFSKVECERLLKVVAVARLLMPNVKIPAISTINLLDSQGLKKILGAGADLVQLNFSQKKYKDSYIPKNASDNIFIEECEQFVKMKSKLESLGVSFEQESIS